MKNKSLTNSFKNAFAGIRAALQTERNIKIHCGIMLLVMIGGAFCRLTATEWIICIGCFAAVIGAELFNTAIEKAVDLASPNQHKLAGLAKDISAGAVLVFAAGAAVIGLLIFVPRIFSLFP